jgi:hypothetical protein
MCCHNACPVATVLPCVQSNLPCKVRPLVYDRELRELELKQDMLERLLLQSVSERNQARVCNELCVVAAKIKMLQTAAAESDELKKGKRAA